MPLISDVAIQDIVILNFCGAPWQLLRNDRDQFVDLSIPQGDLPSGKAPSCTCGDVDGDGLMDFFIGTVAMFPSDFNIPIYSVPFDMNQPSKLFMNKVSNTVGRELKKAPLTNDLLPNYTAIVVTLSVYFIQKTAGPNMGWNCGHKLSYLKQICSW